MENRARTNLFMGTVRRPLLSLHTATLSCVTL
jgi:hypothetical protein